MSAPFAVGRHRRTAGPRRLSTTPLLVLAVVAGLVASAAIIWHASFAAFTATTDNPNNQWSSGTVTLTDNDSGTAMFSASNLKPGSTGSSCITVSYNGSLAAAVKLYIAPGGLTHSAGSSPYLSDYLTITVEEGSGSPGFGDCTGFTASATIISGQHLTQIASTNTNFSNGAGTWAPSGAATKVYRFTYTLDASAPNTVAGQTETATFTWEADNT